MKRQSFSRAWGTASALSLAVALAVAAGPASAQDRKIVPFLTAESSPEAVTQLLDLIEQFEEDNPDIGIELQLTSNDNRGPRIINSVSVGDELGIFEIERRLVPDFTRAGYLLPLDSIVEEIGVDKFIPGSLLYWPWDGNLYQFTSDLSAATLYWRKDLFEEAGLAEPDSYERLLEASQKLHGQNNVSGNAFEASNRGGVQRFVTFLWQNCGDFYTKDGEMAFDRAGPKQAVEDYAELNKYAPDGSHSWGSLDAVNAFAAGRVAMALFPGRLGYQVGTKAPDIAKVTGNREARVARGGKGPRVVYGAVTSYSIGSTVKHPEEAKRFLKFLFTGEPLLDVRHGRSGPHRAGDQGSPGRDARAGQPLHQGASRLGRDDSRGDDLLQRRSPEHGLDHRRMRIQEVAGADAVVVAGHGPRAGHVDDVPDDRARRTPRSKTPMTRPSRSFRTEMEAWKAENLVREAPDPN